MKKVETSVKESAEKNEPDFPEDDPVFDSIDDFMNYHHFEYADETYEESVKSRVGDFIRKRKDKEFFKKEWNNEAKNISNNKRRIFIRPEDMKKLKDAWSTMTTTDSFMVYKRHFRELLKKFGLSASGTVVNKLEFDGAADGPNEGKYSVTLTSHSGSRRIIIPNGYVLIHRSPNANITALKPSFRSRVKGRFLYPGLRVYFSIGKPISSRKSGLEGQKTYVYTPKSPIQTACIDPGASHFSLGAVYVPTTTNIPVVPLEKKKE